MNSTLGQVSDRTPGFEQLASGNLSRVVPALSLEVDRDAAAFIADRGGTVYVWSDAAGMKHVRLQAPSHLPRQGWLTLETAEIRACVDAAIEQPQKWVLVLRHLPWRHIAALWDGETPAAASAGMGRPFKM